MSKLVTINKSDLKSAVIRWAKLSREDKKKIMGESDHYQCNLRLSENETALVRFYLTVVRVDTNQKTWKCNVRRAETGWVEFR